MDTTIRTEREGNLAYQEALERVAKEVSLSPDELENKINEVSEGLRFTPQCLTLAELEVYPGISSARIEHTRRCSFCQRLLQTAEPSTNEVQQFIVDVVGSRRPNKWPTLRDVERELIMKILKESAWNKPQAAEALGINRLKLWWKLRQYARTP